MPRKRSKRSDPLAQKLDFDEGGDQHSSQFGNDIGRDEGGVCPFCPCAARADATGATYQKTALTDCTCASCSALNVAEFHESRDDFCHRDRPRFVYFWDMDKTSAARAKTSSHLHWLLQYFAVLMILALVVGLLLCMKWVLVEGFGKLTFLWLNFEDFTDHEPIWLLEKYWLLGPISICLLAAIIGCSCACLSWNVTYYDSLKPGMLPPTPLSPIKSRNQTRHVFHFGYIMAIANGLAAFTLAWWWL